MVSPGFARIYPMASQVERDRIVLLHDPTIYPGPMLCYTSSQLGT